MSTSSTESLELRAIAQRNRLHKTAVDLKSKLKAAREDMDLAKQAREHFVTVAIIAATAALLTGYAVGNAFTEG
jgi:hypothetical protein